MDIDYDVYIFDEEVKFILYEDKEPVSQVMDTSLKDAVQFFKDNFEGVYILEWYDEELHQLEIEL